MEPNHSMAVMAASVASEFNDELTLLVNELSLSLGLVEREHPARARLAAAQRAALRCTGITGALLEFTRRNGAARPVPLKRLFTAV